MSGLQVARSNFAAHVSPETTHNFDIALHDAVRSSIESMAELRAAVCECVRSLREADVGPVHMILAMKACALDSAGRYHPENDEYPACNVDLLMDQIVRWAIVEYYKKVVVE
jgi:hypothetical protein